MSRPPRKNGQWALHWKTAHRPPCSRAPRSVASDLNRPFPRGETVPASTQAANTEVLARHARCFASALTIARSADHGRTHAHHRTSKQLD
jgi:hypothetical protein